MIPRMPRTMTNSALVVELVSVETAIEAAIRRTSNHENDDFRVVALDRHVNNVVRRYALQSERDVRVAAGTWEES